MSSKSRNEASQPKRADVILQRIAWGSQATLVIAAILGYFYTVRPIYQKQLLDEQIAERTISLRTATATLETLKSEATRLQAENAKLGTEATQVYEQLRRNLSAELLSFPNWCALKSDPALRNPIDVPPCVAKFAKERIAIGLRAEDQVVLSEIIERHSPQVIAASEGVTRLFAAKARQIDRDIKSVKADIEKSEPDVRAEILRLRIARAGGKSVEPDPPSGRIVVRADEDQAAYDNFARRRSELVDRLTDLNMDKVFFDVRLGSAYSDALRKIASMMFDEFRNQTAKR